MDFQRPHTDENWPRGLMKPSSLQKCLHRPHMARLSRLLHALWTSADLKHRRWASRLADCCRMASITYDLATGDTKPWLSTCGSRLCPFCGRGRAKRLARQLLVPIAAMKKPKMLTLTFRSVKLPLADQLRKLRRCFASLRRTRLWRDNVKGGIYSVEVTLNTDTGLWHPHLHAVIDSNFMPHAVLAKLWGGIVRDSAFVWITQVKSPKNTAWELGKYVGKSPDMTFWPEGNMTTYADAIHGQRMMQPFGDQHGVKVPELDEPPQEKPDTAEISLGQLAYLAAQGHEVAQDLVTCWYFRYRMFRGYLFEAWPAVDQVEVLNTLPGHQLPRGPPQPDGRPGLCRDPKQLQELEILTNLLVIQWIQLGDTPLLSEDFDHMDMAS